MRTRPGRFLLLLTGAGLLAASACSRQPAPAKPPEAPPPATRGEAAGVPYLEQLTGGAQPGERVPMVVALHAMGGDPAYFLEVFQRYHRRARLILPYGHPGGGQYHWYESAREDVPAQLVTREADRLAAALTALAAARPTAGKPLVTGFSQGGSMAFALAVTHPGALAAAFPISGLLPTGLYPSAALSSRPLPAALPPVVAFHGAADLAVPVRAARASIAELRRAGYAAELREYPGLEHDVSTEELADLLERLGLAADAQAGLSP